MRHPIAALLALLCLLSCVAAPSPAWSQNQWPTPASPQETASGVVQMCLNSSGQAVPVSSQQCANPVQTTDAGTPGTGISQPAGGVGVSGWLSGIYNFLNGYLAIKSYAPATLPTSSVTRPANTTTYTANTGWCHATSSCSSVFTFANACRANGGEVIVSGLDIWSSNNPTIKLAGVFYLFNATPGTVVNDDATFQIASADYANQTGQFNGISFTLGNQQASSAANSGMSLSANMPARCASGSTTLYGMVEVTNAYVPASAEILSANLHTVGVN